MDNINKSFLGKGWAFPPVFDPASAQVLMSKGEEDIRESLIILISTIPGERIMQPEYGCDVHSVIFKGANAGTIDFLKDLIASAILQFEPRIELNSIDTRWHPEERQRLDVTIVYTVRQTNVRNNLVYPFYFLEGTNLHEIQSI